MSFVLRLICFLILVCNSYSYAQQAILVGHWPMDTTGQDVSGNGHHAIELNNLSITRGRAGVQGTGTYFNGTTSYMFIPYAADFNLQRFSISMILLVKGYNINYCQGNMLLTHGSKNSIGSYSLGFDDNPYNTCVDFDPNVQVFQMDVDTVTNTSSALYQWKYNPTINIDQWYCVTAVYDAGKVKMYIDGSLASTYICKPGVPGINTDGIHIGINIPGSGNEYSFKGIIDDIKLYNGVLSGTEVICSDALPGDTATGIRQVQSASPMPEVHVYPNPAVDNIYCHTSGLPGTYCIYDHTGRRQTTGTLQGNVTVISVQALPAGIYMLQYTGINGRATAKFVKQ